MHHFVLKRGELLSVIVALIALMCIGVFAALDWFDYHQNRNEAVAARQIIEHTDALLIAVTKAESGQRGYLLTGDLAYLGPYQQALQPIRSELGFLDRATIRDVLAYEQIRHLHVVTAAKLDELHRTIELRREGDLQQSLAILQTGKGMILMETIRDLTREFLRKESLLLATRSMLVRSRSDHAHLVFILSSAILLIILGLGAKTINYSTQRREELIHRLSEYAATLDKAQVMIQKVDGSILYWNSGAELMYGWSKEEALGRKSYELLKTEYPRPFEEIHKELLKYGSWSGECRQLCRDGSHIWVATYLAVHRDAEGSPISVVRVNNDITALKHTTKELEISQATALSLFENAAQGILTVDDSGCVVDVNAMLQSLFGYSRGELIGKSVELLLPESVSSAHIWHRAQYASNPHSRPMGQDRNLMARHKDGSEFPVEISLSYVKTHVGGGLAMAFVSDITARQLVNQERDALIARLEGALAEKNVLIKEVHHRVKNNLAVIAGLLGMQSEAVEDERAVVALEKSQKRVLSMALIHEYLYATEHLDRVNFGKYIERLANDLFVSYSMQSDLGGVSVRIEAEEINLPVNTAIPCGLILNELFSNALKYAFPREGTGKIAVNLTRIESDELVLSCEDNGIGIPDILNWQNSPGSVGFRIISILARQIEGKLTLARGTGVGTRFELRFPFRSG